MTSYLVCSTEAWLCNCCLWRQQRYLRTTPVVPNLLWCIPSFAHFGTFHSSPTERSFLPCSGS